MMASTDTYHNNYSLRMEHKSYVVYETREETGSAASYEYYDGLLCLLESVEQLRHSLMRGACDSK